MFGKRRLGGKIKLFRLELNERSQSTNLSSFPLVQLRMDEPGWTKLLADSSHSSAASPTDAQAHLPLLAPDPAYSLGLSRARELDYRVARKKVNEEEGRQEGTKEE